MDFRMDIHMHTVTIIITSVYMYV